MKAADATPGTDQALESIPGLGVIRVRTLRKAGYSSITDLQTAGEAAIATVAGITALKAKQIMDYISQLPSHGAEPAPAAQSPNLLRAQQITTRAAGTLNSRQAACYHRSLARQLGRLAAMEQIGALPASAPWGNDEVTSALAKLEELLTDLEKDTEPGKRRQEKLAEKLRSARKRLEREIHSQHVVPA